MKIGILIKAQAVQVHRAMNACIRLGGRAVELSFPNSYLGQFVVRHYEDDSVKVVDYSRTGGEVDFEIHRTFADFKSFYGIPKSGSN